MLEEYEHQPLLTDVNAIQLDILSPQEIIGNAEVEINLPDTYDKNGMIVPHGLLDLRMGAFDRYVCNACSETRENCSGHFGYIRLESPVYHEYFITNIRDIISCCCFHCGALKIHWQELIAKEKNNKTKMYFVQLRDGHLDERQMSRSHLTMMKGYAKNHHFCANCQKTNPVKVTRKGPFLHTEDITQKSTASKRTLMHEHVTETKMDNVLLPSKAYEIMCKISDLDCRRLGLTYRPEWLMITVLRVLPICDRPSIYSSGRYSEDELTRKYIEIIRENKKVSETSLTHVDRASLEMSLQEHVTHFFTSKYVQSQHRSTNTKSRRPYQPIKSLDTRLRGKKGRFRQNIMGKRVNFTARTVITGDPTLDNDQIGIPLSVAMDLTYTERVTDHNIVWLTRLVHNGPHHYPGATKLTQGAKKYDLKYKAFKKDEYLSIGDCVDRHLVDGDMVVFNRHPSLHKVSLMAHRIKVLPFSTFRMNLSPTAAYNADFDGDEMNIHVPQNEMARAELHCIMHVVENNVTPQASRPILGIVQEATIGLYLLTAPTTVVSIEDAYNLMLQLHYCDMKKWTDFTQWCNRRRENGFGFVTGHSVFSLLLPSDFQWDSGSPKGPVVVDGELIKGQLTKKHTGAVINGLIHTLWTDYGSQRAHDFTSDAQRLAVSFLVTQGFSVGIGDCMTHPSAVAKIQQDIEATVAAIPSLLFSPIEDMNATIALQNVMERAGITARDHLSPTNNMLVMIQSGSKGSITNITQVSGCVGQQKLLGRRIEDQFKDRTLPYYTRFDHGAKAKGFVSSAYIDGLTYPEYQHHMTGGREGLIDTAIKSLTGDTTIILLINGKCHYTSIGAWIDGELERPCHLAHIEYHDEASMESLSLRGDVSIPTTDEKGHVTWAALTHVTRHDPGAYLYDIDTASGRSVTVVASKSLIVWQKEKMAFLEKPTTLLQCGDMLPVTRYLPDPLLRPAATFHLPDGGLVLLNASIATFVGSHLRGMLRGDRDIPHLARSMADTTNCLETWMETSCEFLRALLQAYFANDVETDTTLKCMDKREGEFILYALMRIGIFASIEKGDIHLDAVGKASLWCTSLEVGTIQYNTVNDVVLDKVIRIQRRPAKQNEKVYDVTVPLTLNFMLASGLQVRDTAQCGYVTRKLIKALENVKVSYNGLVLNGAGEVLQFSYGDDGMDPTKLHAVRIRLFEAPLDDLLEWADGSASFLKKLTALQESLHVQFHKRPKGKDVWFLPLDVARYVTRFLRQCSPSSHHEFDLPSAYYTFNNLLTSLKKYPILQALFMVEARPAVFSAACSVNDYTKCLQDMCAWLLKSQVAPGEAVGNLVAQSIGEPTMQMLLNTFHLAGMGNKTTTMGIPRLRELLDDMKTLKSPSMSIHLKAPYKYNREEAQSVAGMIKWQQLQHVVLHYDILFPARDFQTEWSPVWHDFYGDTLEQEWMTNRYGSFYIRYSLHANARMQLRTICECITSQCPNTFALASPSHSPTTEIYVFVSAPEKPDADGQFEFTKYLAGNIPAIVTYGGVEGIKDVFVTPLTKQNKEIEYILETDGINMSQLYLMDEVDPFQTRCNDPNMMLQRFGIEAAARTIDEEIDAVLQTASLVNARHVMLLVHHMTHNGTISAINRHGFDKLQNVGVMEKASFEKGDTILCTGALERKRDTLEGISGQIALGKMIKMGTGYFDVRMDFDALENAVDEPLEAFVPAY